MHVRRSCGHHGRSLSLALLIGIALASCGPGGGGSGGSPLIPSQQLAARQSAWSREARSDGTQTKRARVTLRIRWTKVLHRHPGARRGPHYIPATARSIAIAVNGGVAQYANAPLSTIVIDAPVGTDTFAIQTFDEQNGNGNVLSKAMVTKKIVLGDANVLSAALDGVIADFSIALSNPSPNAGTAASVSVYVSALDADGNVIVGPDDYATPIKLAIADPANSGTLSLSTKLLQFPTTSPVLHYSGGTLVSAQVSASATGATTESTAFSPATTIYEFTVPTPNAFARFIAAGPDGNMWFTESQADKIGRITPAGAISEASIPTANADPFGITAASDGNLWFAETGSSKLGKVTTSFAFTEYSTPDASDEPLGIVDRGDGSIWYTAYNGNHIGYQGMTIGSGETLLATANSHPYGITATAGNLWFAEENNDKVGYINNIFGTITEIALPAASAPEGIAAGSDGNLWVTESELGKIAVIAPAGYISATFSTPTGSENPQFLAQGADGAMWITASGTNTIVRMTTSGLASSYPIPTSNAQPLGIAKAADGSIWFTETAANKIGKLVY